MNWKNIILNTLTVIGVFSLIYVTVAGSLGFL